MNVVNCRCAGCGKIFECVSTDEDPWYVVECNGCESKTPEMPTRSDAIRVWNAMQAEAKKEEA